MGPEGRRTRLVNSVKKLLCDKTHQNTVALFSQTAQHLPTCATRAWHSIAQTQHEVTETEKQSARDNASKKHEDYGKTVVAAHTQNKEHAKTHERTKDGGTSKSRAEH
eukprot:1267150-Amphidinium_carterae.1